MRLDEVTENYGRAARHYDRLTDLVFGRLLGLERYRSYTIGLLGDLGGARVLDVGCGTGRSLPLLARRVGATGTVVGLDYSRGMLKQARRRIERTGLRRVQLVRGDAATLAGLRGPFDAVLSVWCLGIVYDLEAALRSATGVLRPGGRMAIMDFRRSRPDSGALRWLFPVYSSLLRVAGIDTARDLNDARLRARWNRGRALLEEELVDVQEDTYLQGLGLILAGRRPGSSGETAGARPDAAR